MKMEGKPKSSANNFDNFREYKAYRFSDGEIKPSSWESGEKTGIVNKESGSTDNSISFREYKAYKFSDGEITPASWNENNSNVQSSLEKNKQQYGSQSSEPGIISRNERGNVAQETEANNIEKPHDGAINKLKNSLLEYAAGKGLNVETVKQRLEYINSMPWYKRGAAYVAVGVLTGAAVSVGLLGGAATAAAIGMGTIGSIALKLGGAFAGGYFGKKLISDSRLGQAYEKAKTISAYKRAESALNEMYSRNQLGLSLNNEQGRQKVFETHKQELQQIIDKVKRNREIMTAIIAALAGGAFSYGMSAYTAGPDAPSQLSNSGAEYNKAVQAGSEQLSNAVSEYSRNVYNAEVYDQATQEGTRQLSDAVSEFNKQIQYNEAVQAGNEQLSNATSEFSREMHNSEVYNQAIQEGSNQLSDAIAESTAQEHSSRVYADAAQAGKEQLANATSEFSREMHNAEIFEQASQEGMRQLSEATTEFLNSLDAQTKDLIQDKLQAIVDSGGNFIKTLGSSLQEIAQALHSDVPQGDINALSEMAAKLLGADSSFNTVDKTSMIDVASSILDKFNIKDVDFVKPGHQLNFAELFSNDNFVDKLKEAVQNSSRFSEPDKVLELIDTIKGAVN